MRSRMSASQYRRTMRGSCGVNWARVLPHLPGIEDKSVRQNRELGVDLRQKSRRFFMHREKNSPSVATRAQGKTRADSQADPREPVLIDRDHAPAKARPASAPRNIQCRRRPQPSEKSRIAAWRFPRRTRERVLRSTRGLAVIDLAAALPNAGPALFRYWLEQHCDNFCNASGRG